MRVSAEPCRLLRLLYFAAVLRCCTAGSRLGVGHGTGTARTAAERWRRDVVGRPVCSSRRRFSRCLGRNNVNRYAREGLRAPTPAHRSEGYRDLWARASRLTLGPIRPTDSTGPDQSCRRIVGLHAVSRRGRRHACGVHWRPANPTRASATRHPLNLAPPTRLPSLLLPQRAVYDAVHLRSRRGQRHSRYWLRSRPEPS